MVWVVRGNLNSSPSDDPDSTPPPSSHYLRPSRTYRLGRLGGWAEKEGKPKTKARLLDFRIKSLGISKEGGWELQSGDWDATDDPTSPSNLEPYTLTLKLNMAAILHRADSPDPRGQALVSGESVQLGNGDRLDFGKWRSVITFEWIPYVFCVGTGATKKDDREDMLQKAKSAGITLSFAPPSPHHTHFLTRTSTPTFAILRAAILRLPILHPSFLDAFLSLASCGPPSAEISAQIPEHPGSGEGLERETVKWERIVLGLNPDVGADWKNWWGHSELEQGDWDVKRPREEMKEWWPQSTANIEYGEAEKWEPDQKREKMFEGTAIVSYRDFNEANAHEAFCLSQAGGHYLHSNLLSSSDPKTEISLQTLQAEVEDFKRAEGIAGQGTRWALIEPMNMKVEETPLRELAASLPCAKLHDGTGHPIMQAVYSIDVEPLFEPAHAADADAEMENESTPASTSRSLRQPSASGSLPFPSAGIPGTHPDESLPSRSALRKSKGKGKEKATSQDEEDQAGGLPEEEMPSAHQPQQPKGQEKAAEVEQPPAKAKLQRFSRAASRAARDALFDDDDDEDSRHSTKVGGARKEREIRTQDLGTTMEVDEEDEGEISQSSAIPVRAALPPNANRPATLKRRARSQPSASLFDSDDSSDPDSQHRSNKRPDARASKKSREERMKEIQEEDERLATEEAEKARKRKEEGLPVIEEDASVKKEKAAKGSAGKKRAASEAVSGSDEEASVKKSSTSKAKAVPVPAAAPARKRLRSASVQPEDEAGAREVPVATTSKKKAVSVPTATSTAEGGKKGETAAQKKAAKEAQAAAEANLLLIKPKRTTNKNAASDAAFTEDFNALKLVRPKLEAMKKPEKHRMRWDEQDPDEEMNRLIREEQDERDDPDKWAGKATQMFVMHATQLARRERREPRRDLELEEKWRGRANFKRFKPKNLHDPHHPQPQHKEHREPELVVPKPVAVDYGIGEGYRDKRKLAYRDDDDEDDSDLDAGNSPKLNFKKLPKGKKAPATAAKGKGKGKKVVSDSDDDDVSTLNGRAGLDSDDEMLDFSEDAQPKGKTGKAKPKPKASSSTTGKKTAAATKKAPAPAPVKRKPAPTMLVIDSDSDDDDDGLTFKGFGTKRKR